MLINLIPNIEHEFIFLDSYVPQYDKRFIYETGIYKSNYDFNFAIEDFMKFKQNYDIFPNYEKERYGVADNLEQIKEYYKEEIEDENRKFFITYSFVFQNLENKGQGGGWRWHKWGEYIGNLNIKCQYLDDEEFDENFKYVLTFKINEII